MSKHNIAAQTEELKDETTNARRDFLKDGATATGALLGLTILGIAPKIARADQSAPTDGAKTSPAPVPAPVATTLQLSLREHKALATVGGSEIIPVPAANDTLIIARIDAANFAACSAICPHRGCKVEYDHDGKEFLCLCHDSHFALDGKVLKGPSKKPLKNYATDLTAIVSLSAPPSTTTKKVG